MNNQILAQTTNQVTMSSLEIVEFINDFRCEYAEKPILVRHADFMAKVPKVLGFITSETFRSSYFGGNGESRPCYVFPKREACLMAMSYSYELQAQVFDRMTAMEDELRSPKKQPHELSRIEILQIALEAEEENQALRGQISVLEPKAQALEVIANTDSTYTIRDCAKTIGISEKKLIQLLLDKGWVYRDPSKRLQPYSQKCDQKIFINRPSKVIKNSAGEEHVYLHMRVTAYGLTRITGLVNKMKKVAA